VAQPLQQFLLQVEQPLQGLRLREAQMENLYHLKAAMLGILMLLLLVVAALEALVVQQEVVIVELLAALISKIDLRVTTSLESPVVLQ
jgi:uncharacterized membrane protein YfhO